jgi:hypothetical protein
MIGHTSHQQFPEASRLKGQQKEYWMHLCEQAANEQDPHKLMELVKEINRLLEAKEQRLKELPKEIPKAAD